MASAAAWSRLARAWARVVGTAAMKRAAPAWFAVTVFASIMFGGNGMQPSELTGLMRASPGVLAAIGGTWLVLIGPVGTVLVDDRSTAYLRALPAGRRWRWGTVAVFALVAQLPWAALWAIGQGTVPAVIAALVSATAMVGLAAVPWPVPRRAPRWSGPVRAMMGVHGRALWRLRRASLWRGVVLAAIGGAFAGLMVVRNELALADAAVVLLAVLAVALVSAIGGLAAPVAESDRDLGWLLASTGVAPAQRVAAMAAVLAGGGAALGAVAGIVAVSVAGSPALLAVAIAHGAVIGIAAVRAGAWAVADEGDGSRVVIASAGFAGGSLLVIGAVGGAALGVLAVASAALVAPLLVRA
jgi:hypothetical protein